MIGAVLLVPVSDGSKGSCRHSRFSREINRESGASPERSRHCVQGARIHESIGMKAEVSAG